LLDKQGPKDIQSKIIQRIENDDNNKVADLHLWSIGPNIYGVIVSVVAYDPKPPGYYKALIPSGLGLVHVTVEVHRCFDKAELERQIRKEPHSC
jgi:Co/Zn/Cd efflux system component